MEITVFIETDETGTFNAYVNDNMPFGLLGEGRTVEGAVEDFYASEDEMREWYAKENKKFPKLEFVFKYDLESFMSRYNKVFSMPALERLTGINQKQLHHYGSGLKKPREAQKRKIENALHKLGKELLSVRL